MGTVCQRVRAGVGEIYPVKYSPRHDGFAIEAIFPNHYSDAWIGHTLKSVLEGHASPGVKIGATVMARMPEAKEPYLHPLMHRRMWWFIEPYVKTPMRLAYRNARRRLKAGDIAYFWLGSPAEMCRELKDRGVLVVREMINCTQAMRKTELGKAYAQMGLPNGHGITDELIEQERRDLLACDVVICPSPLVKQSVVEYGVPAERCIDASYGWSERRLAGSSRAIPADGMFTLGFVGTIDIRKGAPILLEAWARAKVKGRLALAGRVSPEVEARYAHILARPDVIRLGQVQDVGAVFRSLDAFCLPTWEEGCPLVTIEAMSAGIAPIVTAMGTGGLFAQHDEVGIIVPTGDVEALSGAIQSMAADRRARILGGQRASAIAREFTWEKVCARRRVALTERRRQWLTL